MKIGINTFPLQNNTAGVEVYTKKLIESLIELDSLNRYCLFLTKRNAKYYSVNRKNVQKWIYSFPSGIRLIRILVEQLVLPILIFFKGIDLFFSTSNILPLLCPCKSIIVIHDMQFFLFPKLFNSIRCKYLKFFMRQSAKKAGAIITDAASSKKDIIRILHAPSDKIIVAPPAYNALQNIARKKIRKTASLFILTVSQLHKRKNIVRLIQAYYLLKQKHNIPHKLIIAGKKGDGYDDILNIVNKLKLQSEIILTGEISEQKLAELYSSADIFVYPSVYEGFGMPILEAMTAGCPVVTSSTSSMPEVAGNAAILVNPYSIQSIANGIETVINNLSIRKKLIRQGYIQVKKFSWETTAKKILKVFEDART